MRINQVGNVGIGTTSPSALLDVNGYLRSTDANNFASTGSGAELAYDAVSDFGLLQSFDRTAGLYENMQIFGKNIALMPQNSGNVGIGTTAPDTDALLEMSSTAKGLLIPRMTTAQRNAITTPPTGLLTFGTTDSSFYYYDGSSWVPFLGNSSGASGGWALTGNAGTTVGTNFLGTTDAKDFSLYTNNAERMRVTSAGNIGIGTTSPSEKLDIVGDAVVDDLILRRDLDGNETVHVFSSITESGGAHILYSNSSGNRGHVFHTNDGSTVAERVRITGVGEVGVWTTTPGLIPGWAKPAGTRVIEVTGDGTASGTSMGTFVVSNNRATPAVGDQLGAVVFGSKNATFGNGAVIGSWLEGAGGVNGFGAKLGFWTKDDNVQAWTEKMTISSGGNVGIGTTAPASQLHIDEDGLSTALYVTGGNSGSLLAMFERDIGSSEKFSIHTSNSDVWTRYEVNPGIGTDWNVGIDETNDNYTIWTGLVAAGTTDKLSITPSGNVGIGTTVPTGLLHITHGADIPTLIMDNGSKDLAVPDGQNMQFGHWDGVSVFTERMNITPAGDVGIGTATPEGILHIAGASVGSQTLRGIVMGSSGDFESIELKGTSSTLGGGFIDFGYPGNDFQGRVIYSNSDNAMRFYTAAAERVRITSAGDVGIGTIGPEATLEVKKDGSGTEGATVLLKNNQTALNTAVGLYFVPKVIAQ